MAEEDSNLLLFFILKQPACEETMHRIDFDSDSFTTTSGLKTFRLLFF